MLHILKVDYNLSINWRYTFTKGSLNPGGTILKIKSFFYGEQLNEDQEPTQRVFSSLLNNKVSIFTERVNKQSEKAFIKEYRRQTKADPPKINVKEFIDDATRKNVALIKTIPSQYFDKIQSLVSENVDAGMLTRDFAKQLREISDVSKKRARLIANDQVNKLTGKLNEVRQRNLGVEEYIWRTSQDSRVRSLSNSNGFNSVDLNLEYRYTVLISESWF